MESDLVKQLEDKKKDLMNDQEMRDYIMSEFVNSGFITVHQWRNFVDYLQIMIKRQLEQAIAEIKKQRQEILEKIENINWADVFDGTSYDVVENEVCGHDTFWSKEDLNRDLKLRIKQQLNQPKEEQ